ncbi:hypothetical protein FGB62_255g014 [Gracilaria domingensis]|nr:hypothetical protein FGB62_255g014 [Gracilaria domingensis]
MSVRQDVQLPPQRLFRTRLPTAQGRPASAQIVPFSAAAAMPTAAAKAGGWRPWRLLRWWIGRGGALRGQAERDAHGGKWSKVRRSMPSTRWLCNALMASRPAVRGRDMGSDSAPRRARAKDASGTLRGGRHARAGGGGP